MNNEIIANIIADNDASGIILGESFGNLLYYNIFLRNGLEGDPSFGNGWDQWGINSWYKDEGSSGGIGNYWDDYTGEDNNGDGIGDTPYYIPPNPLTNNDEYPLMYPPNNFPPTAPSITGKRIGNIGILYDYTFVTTDAYGDDVYYYIDWGDDTFEEWIGPYASGEEVTISHAWSEQGTYEIKAKAKDVFGAESNWATLLVAMPVDQQSSQQTTTTTTIAISSQTQGQSMPSGTQGNSSPTNG